jgi:hypothetical protein
VAFIFSSMHLLTRSARLSRLSRALLFSVRIQHSRAARVRVIGSPFRAGSAGREAWAAVVSTSGLVDETVARGASTAVGPMPSVSQPASMKPHATSNPKREAKKGTAKVKGFIRVFQTLGFDERG